MKLRLSTYGSLIQMVDAVGVEQRRAPLDAVHDVALPQQELGEVGAVLAGEAGDECGPGHLSGPARGACEALALFRRY
jgi:hypothetical protein